MVLHGKSLYRGALQAGGVTVLYQVGIEVAGHTVVRAGIRTVGGDIHLEHVVALDVVVILGQRAGHRLSGEHDDAGMVRTDANLILRANHAVRLYAAQFRFLDGKALLTVIELGAQGRHNHLLSGSHIGCAAHNLYRFTGTEVHGGHVHMVGIGVCLAGEHLAHHQALQSAFNGLNLLHTARLQANRGERIGHLLRGQIKVNIFFQPVIRNIHIVSSLF